ncbi:MAG: DUF4294 domain-containing protein [Bacteroidales bacterium]|nr:DUF4294 domain-containing protein [Bacteroidales bacterium]
MKALTLPIVLALVLLGAAVDLKAQEALKKNSVVTRAVLEGSDTLPIVELPEVWVYETRDFEYLYLKRRYRRMIHNVKKAYPYARIAGVKLKELDDHLLTIQSEKEQKAYITLAEKEIMDQFEKDVKRLTVTQGIILVKLIDRETGRTSYQVIKELKGGFTAFFWQGIARVFGNNLKSEYDPLNQDRIMEDIVLGIEAGFI